MKRREFITLIGGAAAAWPLAARAQQPAMPVIGFLGVGSLDTFALYFAAFRKGLSEIGFVEAQNVAIEYRWAEGQYGRMPELADDLVRRRVAVIAMPGSPPAAVRAVKAANAMIPIVFSVGGDAVKFGLVTSLARPEGNATGVNFFSAELVSKRLALLHELVPKAARIAVLVNPADPERVEAVLADADAAARAATLELQVLRASTGSEIDGAFAKLDRADALFVGPDGFFNTRRVQLALQAARGGAQDRKAHSVQGKHLTTGTGRFNLVHGTVGTLIAIAASISTTATGFLFEGLGHWEGFLILAAASATATALLWAAMPETTPAKYLD